MKNWSPGASGIFVPSQSILMHKNVISLYRYPPTRVTARARLNRRVSARGTIKEKKKRYLDERIKY